MPPVIDPERCIGCIKCAQICCMDVFGPAEPQKVPQIRYPEECWHCRACVMDCPSKAITLRYPLPMMLLYHEAKQAMNKEEGL